MKPTRIAGALAATALLAGSGFGLTHHHTATPAAAHPASTHTHTTNTAAARSTRTAAPRTTDPALAWLDSAGGQAQVTFNQAVDTLAGALVIENQATTVANHLVFEADARTVAAQARTILAHPALLPHLHRAAYQSMLRDFITLANLLQPGAGYGTTAQDYAAWYTALRATNITIS